MKHKKTIIIGVVLLAIVLIVSALVNSTYALFSSDAYGANTNAYTTGMLSIEASSKSENISLANALPISDEEGVKTNPYVFTIKNIGNLDYLFDIKLLSTGSSETTFSPQYIKLQIDDGDVITLSNLTNGEIKSDITLHAGDSIDVSIRVWLSIETPNSEIGKSFNSKIVTDGQAVYTSSNNMYMVSLINHITNLYTNANKTTVTNNGITYNYATSVSLMNDRLGGTTDNYDSGNIRYYGANPNNYIDIGDVYTEDTVIDNFEKNSLVLSLFGISDRNSCSTFFDCSTNYEVIGSIMNLTFTDEASCTSGLQNYYHMTSVDDMCGTTTKKAGDPKLYRVIGLFKNIEKQNGTKQDLVKVIREDSIGNLAWDLKGTSESDVSYSNNWHNATLQTILNGAYYNSTTATHSYFDVVTQLYVFGSTIDFKKNGLNSAVHNKIATVVWNLGGNDSNSVYSDQIYGYERGDSKCADCTYDTTWSGKIALAYSSDVGYAADFTKCSETLYNYNKCFASDWLFSLSNGNIIEWLLTPGSGDSGLALFVSFGSVYGTGGVGYGVGVRPVFYLDSELGIESGDGSKSTPFVVR